MSNQHREAGFTQQDVARTLGVSLQTVSNWEGGKHEPKGEHLDSLARLYGVELQGLIEVSKALNVDSPSQSEWEPVPAESLALAGWALVHLSLSGLRRRTGRPASLAC